jgi:cobalamin synthase
MVKILTIFRGLLAFLTAIPVKMDESFLDIAARYMFLFPVIGAVIGFLVGAYGFLANKVMFFVFDNLNNIVFSGAHEVFFDFAA